MSRAHSKRDAHAAGIQMMEPAAKANWNRANRPRLEAARAAGQHQAEADRSSARRHPTRGGQHVRPNFCLHKQMLDQQHVDIVDGELCKPMLITWRPILAGRMACQHVIAAQAARVGHGRALWQSRLSQQLQMQQMRACPHDMALRPCCCHDAGIPRWSVSLWAGKIDLFTL